VSSTNPVIREAHPADLPAIAAYLAPRLGRGGEDRFRRLWEYPWLAEKPNLGFLIDDAGRVGGFVGAIYSLRSVRNGFGLFCNLSSLHVEERFRHLCLPLLARLLTRRDCTFTTCSPSDHVMAILQFFKFQALDREKVVFTPAAGLGRLVRGPRGKAYWRTHEVEARLTDTERRVYEDHRPYRCGQFVVERGGDRCYFVTVRRGHGARAFADVLYASDPELLADAIASVQLPIGRTHRTVLTGIDRRRLRRRPAGAFSYRRLRPMMFRSEVVAPHEIDALYSELVPWYG
jgi:acetoacetyl-CoA synthetase